MKPKADTPERIKKKSWRFNSAQDMYNHFTKPKEAPNWKKILTKQKKQ